MLDNVVAFVAHLDRLAERQIEREAAIDLLTLVMVSDRYIASDERKYIDAIVEQAHWQGEGDVKAFIAASIRRARDVVGAPSRIADYVQERSLRFPDRDLRKRLYLVLDEMANRDQRVVEDEVDVLNTILGFFRE